MLILWPRHEFVMYIVSYFYERVVFFGKSKEKNIEYTSHAVTWLNYDCFFFFFFGPSLSGRLLPLKLPSSLLWGSVKNGLFPLRDGWVGVWHGNCVNNCIGAKYERILLLEERMEKSSVVSSAVLFFFISPFCFDAQWSCYNAAITKLPS